MNPARLCASGLARNFGGLRAVDGVELDIAPGELHAIIGPNGAGKTTLVNLLSGELRADGGSIRIDAREVAALPVQRRVELGLLRSYQITSVFDSYTVAENVCLAALRKRGVRWAVWKPMADDRQAMAVAMDALSRCNLEEVAHTRVDALGYGQRRQLEVAMALAADPSILLLDEPMAGMSAAEGATAIELLRSLKGRYTILLIEHDMHAVFSLADRISVLVYGKVVATGTIDEIRNHPEVRRAYLGDDEDA